MLPEINLEETGKNIKYLMDMQGVTVKQLAEELGLNCTQSVYHWLNGSSMPSVDNLYRLSVILKVPMDMIVCGTHKSNEKWFRFFRLLNKSA